MFNLVELHLKTALCCQTEDSNSIIQNSFRLNINKAKILENRIHTFYIIEM